MSDLLGLALAFIVGFASSYVAQWPPPPRTIWRMYRLQRIRERACYTLPKGKVYLVPSSSSDNVSRYLSEHDMACIEAVATMLRESGYRDSDDFQAVYQAPHDDVVPEWVRTENLVLVCGPPRNRLTAAILRDFPSLLTTVAVKQSPKLAFILRGKRYSATDSRDYAVMAVKRNPYNSKRKIVLLFGLRAIGTRGAGAFYAKLGWAQARAEIADRLETPSGEIEVLLSVDHTPDYQEITHVAPIL